jgi:hypothetical protein
MSHTYFILSYFHSTISLQHIVRRISISISTVRQIILGRVRLSHNIIFEKPSSSSSSSTIIIIMLRTQVKRPSTYNIGGRTPCLKKSKFLKSDHPASVTRTSPLYPVGCGNIIRRKEFTSDSALPNVAFLLRCMFKVKQCKEDGCNQLRQQRSGGKNEKFCRFHIGAKSNVDVTAPQVDSSHPSELYPHVATSSE